MPEEQKPKTGAEMIADERLRQVNYEGYLPDHDDQHANGEIARAARAYLAVTETPDQAWDIGAVIWPWENVWWKPSADPIRNLVKAGALIAAEIDRRQRLAKAGGPECLKIRES